MNALLSPLTSLRHSSQPRVNLLHHIGPTVQRPIPTRLRHDGRNLRLLDEVGPLHDVNVESRADVPSDMTVKRPDAWVVGIELDDNVAGVGGAAAREDLHVATLRVGRVGDGSVPVSRALCQDLEVMAVEMHWVKCHKVVLDDYTA